MQRRLMTWRAGGESINSLILQGGGCNGRAPASWCGPILM